MGISNSTSFTDEEYSTRIDIFLYKDPPSNNQKIYMEIRYTHANGEIDVTQNPGYIMVNRDEPDFPYDRKTEKIIFDILDLYGLSILPHITIDKANGIIHYIAYT